ncbi:MAG: CvpA family protein [Eubacterium sp.]|nr:CvpA family protein [Eubacterium sp.]
MKGFIMILDIIVAVILLLCALNGLRRGFAYTLIHTMGWLIAITTAFVGTNHAKEYLFEDYNFVMDFLPQPATLPPYISDLTGEVMEFTTSMVSTVIIFLAIFLAVKIILTLLLSLFTRNDRESFAGKINSFFGMLAGFLKGYIVVSIILFAMLPLAQFVSADFLIQCQNQIDTSYIAKEIYNTNILPILIKGFTVI